MVLQDIKADTAIHAEKKLKQEYKLMGRVLLQRGLKLYQYNLETEEIKLVELDMHIGFDANKNIIKRGKAHYDPRCLYVQALNEKNAVRKFFKIINNAISKH